MTEPVLPPEEAGPRFPRSVYGVGEEPDPRFSLANERTFLAWIRTSLGLLAGGVAVDALSLPWPDEVASAVSVLLAFAGLICSGQAWWGWARTERAIRTGQPIPHSPASLFVVICVAAVALILLVVTLVTV